MLKFLRSFNIIDTYLWLSLFLLIYLLVYFYLINPVKVS